MRVWSVSDHSSFVGTNRISASRALFTGALPIASLCSLIIAGCMPAPAQPPPPGPPAVTVSYPLERDVADYVDFTGQTAAVKSVDVRARVWGYKEE
jgi:multidrug efflux system membrane fusion protein